MQPLQLYDTYNDITKKGPELLTNGSNLVDKALKIKDVDFMGLATDLAKEAITKAIEKGVDKGLLWEGAEVVGEETLGTVTNVLTPLGTTDLNPDGTKNILTNEQKANVVGALLFYFMSNNSLQPPPDKGPVLIPVKQDATHLTPPPSATGEGH